MLGELASTPPHILAGCKGCEHPTTHHFSATLNQAACKPKLGRDHPFGTNSISESTLLQCSESIQYSQVISAFLHRLGNYKLFIFGGIAIQIDTWETIALVTEMGPQSGPTIKSSLIVTHGSRHPSAWYLRLFCAF